MEAARKSEQSFKTNFNQIYSTTNFFKINGSYSLSVQYYKKSIKIKTFKANVIYAKMHKVATFFTQKL